MPLKDCSILLLLFFIFWLFLFLFATRRCRSVYLGVVELYVWEVCYVYEGYVGSVVILCI